MFLHEMFPAKCIKVGLEAEDKEEVFEEMVDHFCQATRNNAREEILKALREREAKMSTGIHKGIAVPHGKTNVVEDVVGFLGISRKGIDYDALDGEPVYLLFMILAPQKDSEKHLRLLKWLAELLENPQFYMDILSQRDSQEVYNVICKYESTFVTGG
ncbi:MAG: PTS sugar transporter subunit IIA [Treponema sp.]|jgi:PTS system fructose-specific IIC component/PTS system nitrogen regulatory IIA component|nr:PTS sugar transporter subunit IIA [Treponema sp.]